MVSYGKFLLTLSAVVVAKFVTAAPVSLTIIQSTDLHGSPAVAKYAKWIETERKSDPDLLLIDCGDLCNGTFETYVDGGAAMVSFLNHCRYDVWVPGNHEFRIGNENFRRNLGLFDTGSVLAANIAFDDASRKPDVPVLPWKMFTRKGVKIVVIGMTSHRYDDWYDVNPYRGITLLSPVDALKATMPEVRAASPDLIVVAAHSDLKQPAETVTGNDTWIEAAQVYAEYPDIKLFLAGHTHNTVAASEFGPGRWVVQPGSNGKSMAKLTLAFDSDKGALVSVASELVEAKGLPPADGSEMPEVWRNVNAVAGVAAQTPIVRLPGEMAGELPATLLAEAMREAAKSDAAIIGHARKIKVSTPDLTAKFFYGLPASGITVLTLDPAQLKIVLEEQGDVSARSVGIDPAELPAKPVTVAFDAYDIAGCDGERMKLRAIARSGVPRHEVGVNVREAARKYMTARWPVAK